MQKKVQGISLIIVLGICTISLLVGSSIYVVLGRSLGFSANVERSAQMFYAAESGLEAALFHKNARGVGVELVGSGQTLDHPETASEVEWSLTSRVASDGGSFDGVLKAGQTVQVPLYYDGATSVSDSVSVVRTDFDGLTIGFSDVNIDFGLADSSEPIIDGYISGEDASGAIVRTDFTVSKTDLGSDPFEVDIAALADSSIVGERRISFRSLRLMEDSTGSRVAGIPYKITNSKISGASIPSPNYVIESMVDNIDFQNLFVANLPEKTGSGAFDYVIFD